MTGKPQRDNRPPRFQPLKAIRRNPPFLGKVAGGGALALLLILFVIQNSHSVQVNLFWWSGEYPMVLLMAAVAVSAILVWETLSLWRRRRKKQAGGKE